MENNFNVHEFSSYDITTRMKELDFIQNVIARMSDRQHITKNYCLITLGVIFTLNKDLILCSSIFCSLLSNLLIIYSFYKMDSNFLKTEKLYRIWYDFICWKRSETCQWLFELNPLNIKNILSKESETFNEFNPDMVNDKNKKSWSLSMYSYLVILVIFIHIIYLLV